MLFGPRPLNRMPKQSAKRAFTLLDRFCRNKAAHDKWAKQAVKCVDFVEGRQWDAKSLKKLEDEGRPALVFNLIGGLIRLVLGFHRQTKTDLKFVPANDENASEQIAELLNMLWKNFQAMNQLTYIDTEVFMDGLIAGRGVYDTRLDFENNDLGEAITRAKDPFTIVLDADAFEYDISEGNGFSEIKWCSLDEIETLWGPAIRNAVGNLVDGSNVISTFPRSYIYEGEIIQPVTGFGYRHGEDRPTHWSQERYYDFVDPYRKNIRIMDHQFFESEVRNVFVDLETGDRSLIPDQWNPEEIAKVLWLAEQRGNPMIAERRRILRPRWTTMIGDLIIFDEWSPYDRLTINGYFPYFRRGQTRGMVDDLIDPQIEKNKRRSSEIDIVGRTLNSGWIHEQGALDPVMESKLDQMGAAPGIRVEYKKGYTKPEKINPSPPPNSMERLEKSAENDVWLISGINPSAQGQLDRVQSGRAIRERKESALASVQQYFDNFARTRELTGRNFLEIVQKFYVETRTIRIIGEDGKLATTTINEPRLGEDGQSIVERLNDVTIGKYNVVVSEVPASASFQSAEFDELIEILEALAPALGPNAALFADVAVELSSMARDKKDKLAERLRLALGLSTGMATGTVPPPPGAVPALPSPDQSAPAGNVVPFSG